MEEWGLSMEHFLPIVIFVVFAVVKVLKAIGKMQGEDGEPAPGLDSEVERARRMLATASQITAYIPATATREKMNSGSKTEK